jgi:predicted house-cleaning noncanonical NTP pyrophosphatase (MazG superfamily)
VEHEDSEYLALLKNKLLEESVEVSHADKREELIEELADVIAVLEAIIKHLDCEDILCEVADKKFNEKGGFSKRIVLTK